MAGSFRIAEGYVEVSADESGYDRAMERLKAARHTVKVGVDLDDQAALAQLTALTKRRTVKVDIDLSGLPALTQLAEKTRNRAVKVKVSLDEGTAAARLDAIARERAVKVRIDLDQSPLASLTGRTYTADITAKINEAAYQRAQKKLDRLTADRVVQIRANVDTRVGAQEIRNLTQRRQVRIGIDVDTRVAADSLANLTRRRQMTVEAHANTTEARARLDALSRNRHMNIDVGIRGGGLSSLTGLGGAGGGLGILSSRIAQIAAAAIGALPTLASLGESLIQMGPAAAIAAPAVLSLATAFAAVKVGMAGISDAFKAAFAPAEQGAKAALSSTKAVESAQRSLARAEQDVKDAEVAAAQARIQAARDVADAQQNLKNTVSEVADASRRAAESVTNAERDLADAQRAARQAQEDLTQARKDAAMELEDLNNRLADAQLDQRQKVLDLQDAEKQLAKDKAAGAAVSAEQLAKDQLRYDQAKQALAEQQTETQRLQDQTDAANKAGVEGSNQVVAAKQNIADANRDVADKERALSDQQIEAARQQADGAQQIARAERDLADARAAQTKAASDGARQIADANQAVADAARSLAEAQQSGALATSKTADALAKLSPNARAFVQAVVGMRGQFTALRLDVQDRLFQGMAGTFTTMATAALPSLRRGLAGTASVLNTMAKNAAGAVTSLAKTGTLRRLFDGLNGGLRPLSRIPGQFITALGQIGVAAAPAFKRLTTAAGGFADRLSQQLSKAFKSGHLEEVIDNALGIAKQFGHLLGDIAGTIGNVFKAAAAGGGDALGTLGAVFKELRRVTALPAVQQALTSIFTAINAIAKLLAGTLGAAIQAILPVMAAIAPAVTSLATALGPSLAALARTIGVALMPIIQALAPVLKTAGVLLVGLARAVTPLLKPIGDLLAEIIRALAPILGKVVGVLVQVATQLAAALAPVIEALVPAIGPLAGILTAVTVAMLPLVPQILQLLPPLTQLTLALVNLAVKVLTPLLPLITGLAGLLSGVLAGALTVLLPVLSTIIGGLTGFTKVVGAAVDWVVDKFKWLFDVLVGHSIIPDLVNAIRGWFNRLWTWAKGIFTGLMRDIVSIWNSLWRQIRGVWDTFWRGITGAVTSARSWLGNAFAGIRSGITGTWNGLWNGISSKLSTTIGTIQDRIGRFSSGVKKVFTGLRDSLGTIWNGVRDKFAAPVRFVVGTVYNDGIRKMWDTIAGKVNLPQLPSIKLGFARGGIVPGQGRGDTVRAMLTPGERILSLRQVARLGGHAAIDAMVGRTDSDRRARPGRFGIGGVVGDITSGVSSTVSNAVGAGADWVTSIAVGGLQSAARKAISSVVNPLISRIPGSGPIGDLVRAIPRKILDGMLGFLGKKDKDAVDTGTTSYTPGAGVAQWSGVILKALSDLGQSASWLGTVQRRMNQESGGNPNVVNRWDSNWAAGTPSVGLMQVIGPTFKANAGLFRETGPFLYGVSTNPLANTYAGLHYALHRYGSLSALNRPGGYDSGGLLMPGATMAVNRTGRPERVLNADQTATVDRLLATAGAGLEGGGGVTVNLTLNSMTIPSRQELRRFSETAAEEMRRAIRNLENSRRR